MRFWYASAKRASKRLLISAGLESIALGHAARILPTFVGRGLIFTMHRVDAAQRPAFDPNRHLFIEPTFLAACIRTALDAGFVPVRLGEMPERLQADGRERLIAFTFDDGYRDNITNALPVFRMFGVPFTIFLASGFANRTRTVWWETAAAMLRSVDQLRFDFGAGSEQLETRTVRQKINAFDRLSLLVRSRCEDDAVARIDRAAESNGVDPRALVRELILGENEIYAASVDPLVDFGAHSATHVRLTRVSDRRLHREIAESRDFVSAVIGETPTSFAFPYGKANAVGAREISAVRSAGIGVSVTTRPGLLGSQRAALCGHYDRISLNGLYQRQRYVGAQLGGLPALIGRRISSR